MTPSQSCVNLIKEFEGCVLHAYTDQNCIPTIGYGHTHNVTPRMLCSSDQANEWLNEDLACTSAQVNKVLTAILNQNQFDALCSLVFNIGIGRFESSTLLKDLNAGNVSAAADQFLVWDICAGVQNAGLLARRQAERTLFLA